MIRDLTLFIASQLSFMSILTPWAILKEEQTINPNCYIPIHYQFRQWGGVCGYNWEELKEFHQNNYFAMIHALTQIRIFSLICVVLLNLCIVIKKRRQTVAILNMIVFILSMMSTTIYFTEQDTIMVLPIRLLTLQGPGFWAQVLTGSFSLSIVFVEFYMSYIT